MTQYIRIKKFRITENLKLTFHKIIFYKSLELRTT